MPPRAGRGRGRARRLGGRRRSGRVGGRGRRRCLKWVGCAGHGRGRDVDLLDTGQSVLQGRPQLAAVLGHRSGEGVDIHLQALAGHLQLGQLGPDLDQRVLVAAPSAFLGLVDQRLRPPLRLREGALGRRSASVTRAR